MITSISTGNYNVIESNSVILFNSDSDLSLHFKFNSFEFDIIISFETIKEKEGQEISKRIDGNTIKFTCINFNSELGTGSVKPLDIATIENKKLYMNFSSYIMGNISENKYSRKVEYTFYLER